MREIQRIFIHCTAGNQKLTKKDLLREFKSKGWKAPGYHYVVFPDGNIEQLLKEDKVSNGVQGYNSTSINIAYVGGIDKQGRAIDNRTEAQKQSLISILTELKQRYPNAHIMGHRDIWGKDKRKWKKMCPCFDAEAEYAYFDEVKLEKYEDSIDLNAPKAQPEKYVKEQRRTYLDFLKKLRPW